MSNPFIQGAIWALIILSFIFGSGAYLDRHYRNLAIEERV